MDESVARTAQEHKVAKFQSEFGEFFPTSDVVDNKALVAVVVMPFASLARVVISLPDSTTSTLPFSRSVEQPFFGRLCQTAPPSRAIVARHEFIRTARRAKSALGLRCVNAIVPSAILAAASWSLGTHSLLISASTEDNTAFIIAHFLIAG